MFGRRRGGAAEAADESWAAEMAAYEEVGRVRPVRTEAVAGEPGDPAPWPRDPRVEDERVVEDEVLEDVEVEFDDLEPVAMVAPEAPAPATTSTSAPAPAPAPALTPAPAPAAAAPRAADPAQKDHKKNYVAAGAGLLAMAAVRAWRKKG